MDKITEQILHSPYFARMELRYTFTFSGSKNLSLTHSSLMPQGLSLDYRNLRIQYIQEKMYRSARPCREKSKEEKLSRDMQLFEVLEPVSALEC